MFAMYPHLLRPEVAMSDSSSRFMHIARAIPVKRFVLRMRALLLALVLAPTLQQYCVAQTLGSFRTDPELAAIGNLLELRDFLAAQRQATALIERPDESFSSLKYARNIKAKALYHRSSARGGLSDTERQFEDLSLASKMGMRQASVALAALHSHLARSTSDSDARTKQLRAARALLQVIAELGEPAAYLPLSEVKKADGMAADANYWRFLHLVTDGGDERGLEKYRGLTKEERAVGDAALNGKALSGGTFSKAFRTGLPGRDGWTAARVDHAMRSQLNFIWDAHFAREDSDSKSILQIFQDASMVLAKSPGTAPYLLSSQKIKGERMVTISGRRGLTDAVVPGDQIIVRCGALSHAVTVWALDRATSELVVLDPFFEYWKGAGEVCYRRIELRSLYERDLVSLSWKDVASTLVAVIAIRDRVATSAVATSVR